MPCFIYCSLFFLGSSRRHTSHLLLLIVGTAYEGFFKIGRLGLLGVYENALKTETSGVSSLNPKQDLEVQPVAESTTVAQTEEFDVKEKFEEVLGKFTNEEKARNERAAAEEKNTTPTFKAT